MNLIRCNECGNMVPSTASVCPECGCPLDDQKSLTQLSNEIDQVVAHSIRCPKCTSVLTSDMKECPVCGCNLAMEKEKQRQVEEKAEKEVEELYKQEAKVNKRKYLIILAIVVILLGCAVVGWFVYGNKDKETTVYNPNATITIGDAKIQQWIVGTFEGTYSTSEESEKKVSMDIDSLGNVKLHIESSKLTSESEGNLVMQHGDSIKINFSKGYYQGIETSFGIDTIGHRICPEGDAWLYKNNRELQHE